MKVLAEKRELKQFKCAKCSQPAKLRIDDSVYGCPEKIWLCDICFEVRKLIAMDRKRTNCENGKI